MKYGIYFQRTICQVTKVTNDAPEEGRKYLHSGQLCTLVSYVVALGMKLKGSFNLW